MRLSEKSRQVIKECVREIFGPDASVKLFGSRLDDAGKGGDIDLLVETPQKLADAGMKASTVSARIQLRLGVQKIDVLYLYPGMSTSPAHKQALENGILL
ncbi:MAG: nucleotidyltransferase domain-containing protein [Gammaproteobacteria bacterium]|nr:nucleotidyltransferase domain-containing protein [Gammaproteobacteria bacterium]